jgi:F0F1-type ATP synthase membrane subunit c/vacuolar-type H+-ATPase subunit K
MPDRPNQESIQDVFAEALRDTSDLAQKELALFRAELSDGIRQMFLGMAMIVAASVFAVAALMLFIEALVEWLATVVNSEALAALIVGVAVALVAVGLGLYGRKLFSSFSFIPERTMRSVQSDAQALSKRTSK